MGKRRAAAVGALLLAGFVLAGCSGEPTSSDNVSSSSPSPSSAQPTATPTPDDTVAADADAALLPIPVKEISTWAETAVPDASSLKLSGWLSDNSSAHQKSTMQSFDPGTYQAQIACWGEGEITVSAGEFDGDGMSDPVVCANQSIVFNVPITRIGMQVLLDLEGAPSIYAISLRQVD
ncbi:hypothetical protein [Microbacterium sp. W4I20]|uniref:hypothetical protein n=1 Tax=Microbacterium sp. W4I20 TaxID=3042262 RepID=UPI00277D3FD4|nr:hypothetical protein [Microbacterium sp. W4I20]MDQ0729165.1 hypothetical protein [Microbacterium sp. W4I20]